MPYIHFARFDRWENGRAYLRCGVTVDEKGLQYNIIVCKGYCKNRPEETGETVALWNFTAPSKIFNLEEYISGEKIGYEGSGVCLFLRKGSDLIGTPPAEYVEIPPRAECYQTFKVRDFDTNEPINGATIKVTPTPFYVPGEEKYCTTSLSGTCSIGFDKGVENLQACAYKEGYIGYYPWQLADCKEFTSCSGLITLGLRKAPEVCEQVIGVRDELGNPLIGQNVGIYSLSEPTRGCSTRSGENQGLCLPVHLTPGVLYKAVVFSTADYERGEVEFTACTEGPVWIEVKWTKRQPTLKVPDRKATEGYPVKLYAFMGGDVMWGLNNRLIKFYVDDKYVGECLTYGGMDAARLCASFYGYMACGDAADCEYTPPYSGQFTIKAVYEGEGIVHGLEPVEMTATLTVKEAVCKPGETKCVGFDLYECIGNTWYLKEKLSPECGYVRECKEGIHEVLEYCPDGITEKRWRDCINYKWVERERRDVCPCIEGEHKCVGVDLYECRADGKWYLLERKSKECGYVPCEDGERKCFGYDLYECVNNDWVLSETNSVLCGYIKGCDVEGITKCIDFDLYECIGGEWKLKKKNAVECGYVPPTPFPCPIACVCMGTPLVDCLGPLREFRDKILNRNSIGRRFISFYYNQLTPFLSPIILKVRGV